MSQASAGAWSPCPTSTTARAWTASWLPCGSDEAPLVYLSNPDNPMGTWWEAADITRFIDDAAGAHLARPRRGLWRDRAGRARCRRSTPSRPNVVRMRTFSKAYGLAGIRCGYAVGEATLIRAVEKIRNHYGVSRMAQIAGAAALADQAYLAEVVARRSRPAANASPASRGRTASRRSSRQPIS